MLLITGGSAVRFCAARAHRRRRFEAASGQTVPLAASCFFSLSLIPFYPTFQPTHVMSVTRPKLLTWALIGLAVVIVFFALRYGYNQVIEWRSDNHLRQAELELQAAQRREAEAGRRLAELETLLRTTLADVEQSRARVAASEQALAQTRNVTFTLKQAYDQTRIAPIDSRAPISVADACAKLRQLGYDCDAKPDL